MAPRANWKGYLKLSLVSCAVALYPASSHSTRVSFNTLNRKTGHKVKRQYVDPDSGDVVESEDQVKGYAVGKNDYVLVEDEELDAIRIESTHTIDIEQFVPRSEVDTRYLDAPYYIAPEDMVAQEAFAVIREAMREEGVVGLGRVVIARRERVVMLEPCGKGLMGTVLRYAYEVREEKSYFDEIPDVTVPEEMKDLAKLIVSRMAGHFDPTSFADRYEEAVVALVRAKRSGKAAEPPAEAPAPRNVVNLMEALRRSLGPAKSVVSAKPLSPAKPAAATSKGARGQEKEGTSSQSSSKSPAKAPARAVAKTASAPNTPPKPARAGSRRKSA